MAAAATLTDDQVRRLRVGAQQLHRPGRRSTVDLVRHLTGVQAQVVSAAGLALRARTRGLSPELIDRARLHDRSLVLTWAMRGTLHLVAAEDYGWLVPLVVEPRVANAHRRLREVGVPAGQPTTAVRLIERMLEREGPLTRSEIAVRLSGQGIRTEGQAIAHLVWLAAAEGVICYGPDRGREQCFVLVRDWLGELVPRERAEAVAELALRFLRAHGPSEPGDLAFWSGIRLSDARRGWRAIEHQIAAVDTARGTRWTLRSPGEEAPGGVVRLLPSFDEYLLGWRDRGLTASAEHWQQINRGGGWLHPVLVYDGQARGTWRLETGLDGIRLEIHPFSLLEPAISPGLVAEAEDLAAYLGTPVRQVALPAGEQDDGAG